MGQKTNARIFRLGINKKNWELNYIEKNNEEASLFLYKTFEVQRYINRFFTLCKIKISNCKIFYSNCSLQIFISFYITKETIPILRKINIKNLKIKYLRKFRTLSEVSKIRRAFKKIIIWRKSNIRKYLLKYPKKDILKTAKLRVNTNQTFMLNQFKELLLENLTIYVKKKVNIFITFQNLNNFKQLSHSQIKDLKIIFKQLKKFARNSFYKEAINILFINICVKKSSKLIAEFISDQFKLNQLRLKTDQTSSNRKDNRFLGFLKQAIKILIKSQSACITGIKIVTKGRFNKAPRSKNLIIQFGKFSLQSFTFKIDYSQSTAYTKNGTFGVKVWVCEK